MPSKIPDFRPPRIRERPAEAEASRPNANERGYCSAAWKAVRKQVLTRDGYQCMECGRIVDGHKQAHVDHIVPRNKGGTDEPSNLRTLCASCHSSRTARDQRAGYTASPSDSVFAARDQKPPPVVM